MSTHLKKSKLKMHSLKLLKIAVKILMLITTIDPMQKWLPVNYSFVRIQNSSLTSFGMTTSLQFLSQKRG